LVEEKRGDAVQGRPEVGPGNTNRALQVCMLTSLFCGQRIRTLLNNPAAAF
jgi:hypothetical protein